MADNTEKPRGKVPIREFLADFRSALTDRELREKYGLSARGFVSLIKALLAQNVISSVDLAKRREMSVQRDLARESQFLAGLYICPNCSHPSPQPFARCPACGAPPPSTSDGPVTGVITPTENHVFVEESPASVTQETEVISESDIEEEVQEESKGKSRDQAGGGAGEDQGKPSAMDSLKSLFSKLKKK
ncbi:MAG: hypothetical protein HY913_02070 [Desulfomonile tiedjei]|nr:hypothetical protein [Desulfomonile tiedjei]